MRVLVSVWGFGLLVLLAAGSVRADIVTNATTPSPSASFTGIPSSATPNPGNNDVTTASPNYVTFGLNVVALTKCDVELLPTLNPGTTEYFVTNTITNNTSVSWSSLSLQLGTGFYNGTTDTFNPITSGTLTFDSPLYAPAPTSDTFTSVTTTPYNLMWSGGAGLAPGQSATITFSIDVPNNSGPTFTVRGTAAVPEPSTFVLLGMGAIGLLAFAWRRRKRAA
jgi:hypothetical protein